MLLHPLPCRRRRWVNPLKTADDTRDMVCQLLLLAHLLRKHGLPLAFPIPDSAWEQHRWQQCEWVLREGRAVWESQCWDKQGHISGSCNRRTGAQHAP